MFSRAVRVEPSTCLALIVSLVLSGCATSEYSALDDDFCSRLPNYSLELGSENGPLTNMADLTESLGVYYYKYSNELFFGQVVDFHGNGQLKSRGWIIEGSKHGLWEYYDENGSLSEAGNFRVFKHGLWEYFRENGSWSHTGNFKCGRKDGRWTYFYGNDSVSQNNYFKSGNRTGVWELFHSSGWLIAKTYFTGEWDFLQELFDQSGNLTSRIPWKNGMMNGLREMYYEDGSIEMRVLYQDGDKTGLMVFFDSNGQPKSQSCFQNNEQVDMSICSEK